MRNWRRARLDPPITATLKRSPDDFVVEEALSFEPSGDGEHCLVQIEKTGLTTPQVADRLARAHGIAVVDVGYAGMKDKQAVTRQWFSLRGVDELDAAIGGEPGIRVLAERRHERKLRRGEAAANRFRIVLRNLSDRDLGDALTRLERNGAPNYFGTQRFGRDNLDAAKSWLERRRRSRTPKFKQGLYLSVLRSYLFNEVLAERVARSSWAVPISGDVLEDGRPTGPLWGRGRSPAGCEAARIEQVALEDHREICDGLEHAGVRQDRRSLVLAAEAFHWSRSGTSLNLAFSLPGGGYATSFLAEVFDLQQPEVAWS